MATKVQGFPQSSNEHERWVAQGRTFSGGSWYEPDSLPTGQTVQEQQIKPISESNKDTLSGLLGADQLSQTGDFKINELPVEQKDLTTATGYWAKVKADNEAEQKRIEQEKKDKEAALAAETTSKWDKFKEAFGMTTEQKQTAEYQELGVDPAKYIAERTADIAEMEKMMEGYDAKVAERDNAIAQQQTRPGATIDFQDRTIANITNKYNIELNRIAAQVNTKSAIMAQKQGLINEARSFAKEAVDAYTYDMKLAYDQIIAFEEDNEAIIDDLDQELKDSITESKNIAYQTYQDTQKEKNNVMDLMLQAPGAGIKLEDTLEEATKKASSYSALTGTGLTSTIVGGFEILRDATGKIVSTKSVSDGTSNKTLTNLLNEVPNYETREEALADLNKRKSSIIREVGESGFNQLKSEVDIVFPAAGTEATSKTLQEERKKLAKSSVESGNLGFIDPESGSFVFNAGGVLETEKDNGFWAGVTKLLFTK